MCSRLIRPFTTRSTPQPVISGALVVSCMRYGVSDINHLKSILTQRYYTMKLETLNPFMTSYSYFSKSLTTIQVIKMVDQGHRLPPTPGLTKELYKIMIGCW